MDLAFIGLGAMGAPMARRLLAAGHRLAVWNRTPAKAVPLAEAGARLATSPADAARGAAVTFLCVLDTATVEDVVFGADGAAQGMTEGAVLVDFSSIRPDATRRFTERLRRERGAGWIDAPVSGGVRGAAQGTLAVMAGGEAADLERARPALRDLAGRVTHMGPSGAGQTAKLCNQIIVGGNLAIIAEAIAFARGAGIDPARLPDCFKGGFADSGPLQVFGPRMAERVFEPVLAGSETLLKDLDTALEMARDMPAALPMTALADSLYRRLKARGLGKADISRLVTLLDD